MTLCVDHCGTLVSVESRIKKKSVIEVFKGTIVERKNPEISLVVSSKHLDRFKDGRCQRPATKNNRLAVG